MAASEKRKLARAHLERALPHVPNGDIVEAVTWLHLAAEAAVTAAAESASIPVEKTHPSKMRAAEELHRRGLLATNLGEVLGLLNQARKETNYEGEDPDLRGRSLEEIAAEVEEAVASVERLVK